jgi:hypothetical protein
MTGSGCWRPLASWLTSRVGQRRRRFPRPILNLINQDSCHRRCSRNPLNRNRFQLTSPDQFCPLPFPIASSAYKKCKAYRHPAWWRPALFRSRAIDWPMVAPGQKRRFGRASITSGLPRQADVFGVRRHVSKMPTSDIADANRSKIDRTPTEAAQKGKPPKGDLSKSK